MTHAQAMLETTPGSPRLAPDRLAAAIDDLVDCASTCNQCADACLAEGDPALARCIRLNLDCADVCAATARVISRQTGGAPGAVRSLLEACMAACRSCGDECEGHGAHMEHCAICAEQCRRCEETCRSLLAAMS
jgi:hypothetical protein